MLRVLSYLRVRWLMAQRKGAEAWLAWLPTLPRTSALPEEEAEHVQGLRLAH